MRFDTKKCDLIRRNAIVIFLKRTWPILIIFIFFVFYFYFGLDEYISFKTLQKHHKELHQWTMTHYPLAVLVYAFFYITAVTISIPGAAILTLAGGYLFGIIQGTIIVVFSATIGASLLFVAVQTSMGPWLEEKTSNWLKRLRKGFQENAFYYLLTLRLIPLVPFWVLNIVPALLGMNWKSYVSATALGIIPGSLIYVMLGNGLSYIFASGKEPNYTIIFSPPLLIPILGLALLALLPVLYKKLKKPGK